MSVRFCASFVVGYITVSIVLGLRAEWKTTTIQLPIEHIQSRVFPSRAREQTLAWVEKYNVSHLFQRQWTTNGDYDRYLMFMKESPPAHVAAHEEVDRFEQRNTRTAVIDDALESTRSHPHDSILVDHTPHLRTTSNALPLSRNLSVACTSMRLHQHWQLCRTPHPTLPSTTHSITVAIRNAFVDAGTCHEALPGTVFNSVATWHFQPWTNNDCYRAAIHSLPHMFHVEDELMDSLGVYLSAPGHFFPEQLPRILHLCALCPPTAKLLVASGGVADAVMDVLVERGVVAKERIIRYSRGATYFAKVVYRSEPWPYLPVAHHRHPSPRYLYSESDMQLVHRAMSDDLPDTHRDTIIVIKRKPHTARSIREHDALVETVYRSTAAHLAFSGIKVAEFSAEGHIRDHIALFQRALVLIGPHGAGMSNLLWMKPGSCVIEIGYDSGMILPEMYAEMAIHSGHHYYLVRGKGDYARPIDVNWTDLVWALQHASEKCKRA